MKKLFTLAAAMLASFSLLAAEPNYESYDWGADDFATVFANHDGIVLSSDASAWKGNLSGKQYVALGGGTDLSVESPTPYFGITADAPIDSIEVFWAPNGTNNTSVAWAGWENASELLNQTIVAMGKTETYAASKSYEDAIWQKIDLSGYEFKAVMLARQIKKAIIDGKQQSNFGDNQTVNILGIRVWLHETKTVVSTVDTLTAVTINDYPLAPADFNTLLSAHTLILEDSAYLIAPVVKFTKHTVITYDDETTKEKDEVIEKTSQQSQVNMWGAMVDIAGVAYSVYTMKPLSYTVTYKMTAGLEDIVLGTEIVKAGTSPQEYAQYEVRPLCTFNAWYDADYLEKVDLSQVVVNSDMSFYADFSKAYATSLNIEQLVLDYGTTANIDSILTAQGFGFEKIDALDTLNDLEKKDNRNYAYLGLKLKKAGAYVACNIQAGSEISVKFGNVGDSLKIGVNGEYQFLPKGYADILTYKAEAEAYLEIITVSSSTVVLKQIMINDTIADVTLPAPGAYPIALSAENGKLEAAWEGKTDKKVNVPVGATVTLTATADEGYKLVDIKVNGVSLNAVENVYSFTMPAEEVTVVATFESEAGEKDTDATIKSLTINGVAVTAVENVYAYEVPANENIAQVEVVYELNSAKATATPASGFKVDVPAADAAANTQIITVTAENGDKAEYTVSVTRAASEAIDNTSVTEKAVKVIRNCQLIIEKNGVRYNVLGAVVR